MTEWDGLPPPRFRALFDSAPTFEQWAEHFRLAWGPVFYRGRLDGSARVLVVAQSPGPAELVVRRGLAGLAGQRLQGFLTRLGLTRSYTMGNAFLYGLQRPLDDTVRDIGTSESVSAWRNQLFDALVSDSTEVVVGVGRPAQAAVDQWPGSKKRHVVRLQHPNYEMSDAVFSNWNEALEDLGHRVKPDAGATPDLRPYGKAFTPADQTAIPTWDLPFGAPRWLGDGVVASRADDSDAILITPTASRG
jgi:hypothetical protein